MEEVDKECPKPEEIDGEYQIIEAMVESYKSALKEAREYYLSCKGVGIIPEKGLQKVVYDLGKKISVNKEKAAKKSAAEIEEFNRFANEKLNELSSMLSYKA